MIDEKKLIDELDRKLYAMQIVSRSAVLDIIKEQPKVGEWIPCSERLPEEPEENPMFEGAKVELYLVSCGDEFYPFRVFWNGKDFTDGLCKVDAEAWMPLPEPYKKEGTGHKEE